MRGSAAAAVRSLGHDPIMAEAFDAGLTSPRVACLQGVREADLIVLVLGGSYGAVQANSDLSATHEEWREAKDRRPVIAFVQDGVERDVRQADFVREVQDWAGGLFRGGFRDAADLRDAVTRSIHNLELSTASAAVDVEEMLRRARELMPVESRGFLRVGGPLLHIVVVGGPAQTILRPIEIEKPELARGLLREANYGGNAFFSTDHGSKQALSNGKLSLSQDTGAELLLDERGSVRLSVPVAKGAGMMGALIEENVADALNRGLAQIADIWGGIDDAQRLSRFVAMVGLSGGAMGWRTRREDDLSPNSMTMSRMFQGEPEPVHFQPADKPRAALSFDRERIIEDLVTLLRRQWR